jgi:hypothetical protein
MESKRESGRSGLLEGKGKRNHARHTSHTEECLEWNFSVPFAISHFFLGGRPEGEKFEDNM